MNEKRFLIPLGAAVAALLPLKVHGAVNASETQPVPADAVRALPLAKLTENDPVIQELTYTMQSEVHALLLRQSSTGVLYAGHGSHGSHGSHQSHGSHRSGY